MANFKINNQYSHMVQQGDSITNNSSLAEDWLPADGPQSMVDSLLADIDLLIKTGELNGQTGTEIRTAVEEATTAKDRCRMVNAFRRASKIANGIVVLGGVAESINNVIGLVAGGS